MSVVVHVRPRGGDQIVNLTLPGPDILSTSDTDFHATFNGNNRVFAADANAITAVGSCLRTAASLSETTGFSLPEGFSDLSYTELGRAAFSDQIPGVRVRQSNQA